MGALGDVRKLPVRLPVSSLTSSTSSQKPTTSIRQGDALNCDFIPDDTIDLVITSPPYFALRAYKDNGEVIAVVGNEPTPRDYITTLLIWMKEMRRVLKPTGSVFVVLGDKMSGSGGHNNSAIGASKDRGPGRYNQESSGVRNKSLMGLPWRFANACVDDGWILRAEIVWSKPNGMPESTRDRVRRTHESIFHFTKEGTYYSAVDRIRTPPKDRPLDWEHIGESKEYHTGERMSEGTGLGLQTSAGMHRQKGGVYNPLGASPRSVWEISTSGLTIPADIITRLRADRHYAAFPPEIPRRIITGWCPRAICLECGQGRTPLVRRTKMVWTPSVGRASAVSATLGSGTRTRLSGTMNSPPTAVIVGEKCGCPPSRISAPSTPAIVLDPFAGAGTTALVAKILGRSSISVDISRSYVRLAQWRVFVSDHQGKLETKWRREGLL